MHALQNCKFVQAIRPAAIVDNAAFTGVAIDTTGWDYATFVVSLGVTDIGLTAFYVAEGDNSSPTTEITATDFSDNTQTDWAGTALGLPDANSDNTNYVIHLALSKRKQYLKLVSTGGDGTNGTYMSAVCILSRGEHAPTTNTEAGAAAVVVV